MLAELQKIFRDLERPPGRFRSPVTFSDRIAIASGILASPMRGTGVLPVHWQSVIRFLYRSGWLESQTIFTKTPDSASGLYRVQLRCRDAERETDGVIMRSTNAFGKDADLETALSKAVGEALERRALLLYRNGDFLEASVADLRTRGQEFLDPAAVSAFSEEQKQRFPNRRFNEKSIFRWARGFSLIKNIPILIPAQLIFWNYRYQENEPVLQQRTTNGAAGMFTREEAVIGGIFEILEREAFLSAWISKKAPPRISPHTIPVGPLAHTLRELEANGLSPYLFRLSGMEDIPVFAAAILDRSGKGPAVAVGGGCDASALKAADKALSEAVSVRAGLAGVPALALPEGYEPFFSPLSLRERLRLWANPVMLPAFEFFTRGMSVAFSDPAAAPDTAALQSFFDSFRKKSPKDVVVYEAEHPVLSRLGYTVVRVIVPSSLPFYLSEEFAPLGTVLFRDAGQVNTVPHPFP